VPTIAATPVARRAALVAIVAAVALAVPAQARAEIVTLTTGRTLSVVALRIDGTEAVLVLRGGGEIRCPATWIASVAPDEVAPEPEVVEAAPPDAAAATALPDLSTRPYAPLIADLASRHGLEPRLVHAVVQVESGYAARARSRAGARGLMQVMPSTGRQYGVRNLYEPKGNLDAGMRHLKALLSRFDLPLALAAYNAGEATVRRFGGIPPFAETQAYVRRVLALAGLASAIAPR
jgi:soluble lytic murein transglycosylase-like protein